VSKKTTTAADRALLQLLAIETGQVAPVRTASAGVNPFPGLAAAGLVKPDRASGRYVLTKAGRRQAEAAQARAGHGSAAPTTLRAVLG
jgi:hypothetical protein